MSIKVSQAVWERSSAKLIDRLVLLYIADCCNHDGSGAYPAIKTIAKHCQASLSAVYASIKRLQEMGELRVSPKSKDGGLQTFTINLDALGSVESPPHGSSEIPKFGNDEFQSLENPTPKIGKVIPKIGNDSPNFGKNDGDTSKEPSNDPSLEPSGDPPPQPPRGSGVARTQRQAQKDLKGFDEWYRLYPRHLARADAERAWSKLKTDDRKAAYDAIQSQLEWPIFTERDIEKIPYPASWLNARRWEDERPAPARRTNGGFTAAPPVIDPDLGYIPQYNKQGQELHTLARLKAMERREQERSGSNVVETTGRLAEGRDHRRSD